VIKSVTYETYKSIFHVKTPTEKQIIGRVGEDLTSDFLKQKGFSVISRNYLKPWGEIDIVAKKDSLLLFVEVKTVTRNCVGGTVPRETGNYEPEDNIHPWKRKRLLRVIQTYLLEQEGYDDLEWRVDVACVYLTPEKKLIKIDWLEDIVL